MRIICDSNLHIPLASQIVKTASEIETIVACSQEALEAERKQEKIRKLKEAGIQLIGTEGAHGVNLVELMKKLGEQNIDSILLEGGGTLNASALEDGIVNKVYGLHCRKAHRRHGCTLSGRGNGNRPNGRCDHI